MSDQIQLQNAQQGDLSAIVRMLANDPLGANRERFESPSPKSYRDAFESIDRDPNNELIVATLGSQVVGVLQVTFIPYLTFQGGWRALVEGVHVASAFRSQGIGRQMMQWVIDRARKRRCHIVQLTTDKARPDAIRFYEGLGFKASHEGMKLMLEVNQECVKLDA